MLNSVATIIKYTDLFGTRCTFYSEKMPKLYTVIGGIFSMISILVCILIFLIFSIDDLKRKFPITTTSSIPSEGYRKIKFGKEKIWIPWRIVDYNNNEFVNTSGLLYPKIYYYYGIKVNGTRNFNLAYTTLNYKLCNETSMAIENNTFQITVPLNELYCIEMDNLEMGGSWITEYINYIQFDLYYCEDGISYNETDLKCTSFYELRDFIGKNNSLQIDIYYPVVQFQPTNKTHPIIVIYRNYFYHISRYTNKIDRIFLQENVLTDDLGWILTDEFNHSYWGLNSINGDSYFTGNEDDLMNEGSNSRVYSFNLYLEPGIIHYKRCYKKLYIIFSDFFPVAYIIFIIMKTIAKLFKKVETNKKMIELLFENLKEKPNIFENNIKKLKFDNQFNINILNKKNNNFKKSKFINEIPQTGSGKINTHNLTLILNKNDSNNNNSIKGSSQLSKKVNSKFYEKHKKIMNNSVNQNLIYYDYFSREDNSKSNDINENNINEKKNFIKQKLFPYKYYLCSIFIKNLNASENNCFFSSRFIKIYAFLCQLFDITTYLLLHREFNALKSIYNEKNMHLIEKNKKININSNSFIKNINQCIEEQKFYILAQGFKK